MIHKISHVYLLDCQDHVELLMMHFSKDIRGRQFMHTSDGLTEYRGCAQKTKTGRKNTQHKRVKLQQDNKTK